ncbi:stage II sporulation protein E [Leptospira ryugenii]|uniref:Stage II sporulation protein E n=1 Tax=Leptospira ryugenii TaxID=1917863 RepID=A0A2P2DX83_9LEPT|nr:SpoIIE family protein phosphatase [Leptospira ryugenii]GBF49241.1 stage II sporulation protein E [Leptospira ryugenii]
MGSWGPIAFDFYSFGSLVGVIFTFFNAQFFLTVKEKSKATLFLGMATLSLGLFHTAYLIGFSLMGPGSAYLRWLVMPNAMLGATFLCAFFLSFPEEYYLKTRKIVLRVLLLIILITTLYFIFVSFPSGRVFYFSGHYWDFPVPKFYKMYGIMVVLYFVTFIILDFIQLRKMPKESRIASFGIMMSFALLTIIPGVLNIQSRDGAFERGLYQTITDLLLVVGLFLSTVLYINSTKDKTTILSRIIGIALATFLLVIQLVAYFSIHQTESSFDMIYFQKSESVVQSNKIPNDTSFYFSYSLASQTGKSLKDPEGGQFSPNEYVEEFWNVWMLASLSNLSETDSLDTSVRRIFQSLPESTNAYQAELRRAIQAGECQTAQDLVRYLESIQKKIIYTRNKWRELQPAEIRTKGRSLFSQKEGKHSGFHLYIQQLLDGSEADEALYSKIDHMLAPVPYLGERNYRGKVKFTEANPKAQFYISYFVPDLSTSQVHEVGFPYERYRDFQHEVTLPWMYGGLGLAVLVIFGFRFFFGRALIRPIKEIIDGLTEVNSGNLDYRLSIHVEDDIGFMARSFNRMVRSIQAARKRLQQYASQLEEKVQERTKELENTLQEVRALKDQQDGDYFLTSLLLQPFSANHVHSDKVQIDFLLEQKKKFTFRQHAKEIGGDLNIANQILLNDKVYTVFLNADAMGKSMQGAGGALVLGSVFESIITRTQISPEARRSYPERWIKNSFVELHKVFEGFDGSMLVSLVLGLIDNETGLLYFINAEHPWMVLYRDGIASFLENELMFRKLGTSGVEGDIFIRTFQLEPGDVVIAGSDGRDDLLISLTADGKRIINEDERLFLKVVERGKGELELIYEELRAIGSFTDDLSLLRISFHEEREKVRVERERLKEVQSLLLKAREATESKDLKEAISYLEQAHSLEVNIPEIKKKFIQLYLKNKDFEKVKRIARDYSEIKPMDTEIMYVTAYSARKVGDLKTAIDFGERVRLRDPQHVKNLLNLGQAYLADRNFVRAEIILNAAWALDSENPSLEKLLEHVRKKQSPSL